MAKNTKSNKSNKHNDSAVEVTSVEGAGGEMNMNMNANVENTASVESVESVESNVTEEKGECVMSENTESKSESVEATSETAAPALTPLEAVMVGINTEDPVLAALKASREKLVAKRNGLVASLQELDVALAKTDGEIEAAQTSGSIEEQVRKAAEAMLAIGMFSVEEVRAALLVKFNRSKVAAAVAGVDGVKITKTGKVRKAHNEHAPILKKITLTISKSQQQAILREVEKSGKEGVRLEDLKSRFDSLDQAQILGTLKNAVFDQKLQRTGASRGMRYSFCEAGGEHQDSATAAE